MSSNQGHEEQGPERSGKTDQSAAPLESADALRGGEPGGRKADGLDAAQRVEDESSHESELESPELEDLARDVRLKLTGPRRGTSRTRKPEGEPRKPHLRPAQRLLILDTWLRSQLPAREFSSMFGLSPHTLYSWKQRFDESGPAGLDDATRGRPRGSRLSWRERQRAATSVVWYSVERARGICYQGHLRAHYRA